MALCVAACRNAERDTTGAALTCGWKPSTRLTSDSVANLRIGLSVEELRQRCRVVRDTVRKDAEGGLQRVVRVQLGPAVADAEVTDGVVWRLTVTDPRLRTRDDIGVGSPLSQLLAAAPAWAANGETGVFVGLRTHCGLSFRLDTRAPGVPRPWVVSGVADLRHAPPSTPVDQVLAVGSGNC